MVLRRLARSVPVVALAVAATFNLDCALPQVNPRLSGDFASGATAVRTLAVLPIDLSVQIAGQSARSQQSVQLDAKMLDRLHRGLGAALARRGYQVSALLEPNGAAVDPRTPAENWRLLIHPKDLAALRIQIHQMTSPIGPGPGLLETRVAANLTSYLGKNTGADATLYARGWAYVAPPGQGSGATAAKVIIGVLLALLIVGLLFALFSGKGGGHRGGGAAAGAARAVATTAAIAGHVALRTAPLWIVAAHEARYHRRHPHHEPLFCYTCAPPPPPPPPPVSNVEPYGPVDEPMPAPPVAASRPATRPGNKLIAVHEEPPPVIYLRQGPPPTGHEVGLAITLVHNKTGRVLWHAGQRFEVKPEGENEVDRLVEHFLQKLPPAR